MKKLYFAVILVIGFFCYSLFIANESVESVKQRADQGVAEAQHNLGVMYFNGDGVRQDYAEALKWYRKAAEQGYALTYPPKIKP